jgi:hypothetical protein
MSRKFGFLILIGCAAVVLGSATAALAQVSDPYSGNAPTTPVVPTTAAQSGISVPRVNVPRPRSSSLPPGISIEAEQAATNAGPTIQVLAEQQSRGQTLPVTGADVAGLAVLASVLLGVGVLLVVLGRSRRTA